MFRMLTLLMFGAILLSTTARAGDTSRYKILENQHFPKWIAEIRTELEDCIADIGFVSHLVVDPRTNGALVKVAVKNNSHMKIVGLVVQSNHPEAVALGLDGKSIIEFKAIDPGQTIAHSEFVPSLGGLFSTVRRFTLRALDVIDINGTEVVGHIFETRWPVISSAEELETAQKQLCKAKTY